MSSFTRTMQRRANRGVTKGAGCRLGVKNDEDKALLARLMREIKHA